MGRVGIDGRNCALGFNNGDLVKSSVINVTTGQGGDEVGTIIVRDACYLVEAGYVVATVIASATTGACAVDLTQSGSRGAAAFTTTFTVAAGALNTRHFTRGSGAENVAWASAFSTKASRLLNPGDRVHFQVTTSSATGEVVGWVILRRA